MKHVFAIALLFTCNVLFGQNILSNSNFAQHHGCPETQDQLAYCDHWSKATIATPDYYHWCYDSATHASLYKYGVPQSWMAYQDCPSHAQVGMYGFQVGYREYIKTSFPALIPGGHYKVSMVLSFADSSGWASAGYGIYFYKNVTLDSSTMGRLLVSPQIDYAHYGIITNDTAWTTLTDTFTADSAYTHLVVGNFHDDAEPHMDTMVRWAAGFSYYVIDSIAVELVGGVSGIGQVGTATMVNVFPNPAGNHCTFSFAHGSSHLKTIAIYSMDGKLMLQKEDITEANVQVDLTPLSKGIYLYQVADGPAPLSRGLLRVE